MDCKRFMGLGPFALVCAGALAVTLPSTSTTSGFPSAGDSSVEDPTTTLAIAPIKDFTLPSASDGSLIRLSDYAGKVILLNWWRTDC
jgi:hypothetical protein